MGAEQIQVEGQFLSDWVENSHLPLRRRRRAMQLFRRMQGYQIFTAVHAAVFNRINPGRRNKSQPCRSFGGWFEFVCQHRSGNFNQGQTLP
ncbi:hypothetical protein [Tropicimonas sp. TH_r6]|uniref:hypothetical protein n=1 Tax=Tropicimonas sp. TH_r6 TaxID=3082085 RepID=UPI0039867E9A